MIKKLKTIFGNSFKIDCNIKDARVTYIVDPYDRSKDIVCKTPCKINIPWEPQRFNFSHNKDKILIEKEGYKSKVVKFKYGFYTIFKVFIYVFIVTFLIWLSGDKDPLCLFFVSIIFYSIGSDSLHVTLEEEKNYN